MDYEIFESVLSDAVSYGIFEGLIYFAFTIAVVVAFCYLGNLISRFLFKFIGKKVDKKRKERSLAPGENKDE